MTKPLFYKDLLGSPQEFSESEVGRKGLSLTQLVSQQIPVPPFFILPPSLFESVIKSVFKETSIKSLDEFRKHINELVLSPEAIQQIETEYGKLSGFGKAWVAVRSSIVAPEHPTSSFSGLLMSKLNLRGTKEIELAIREIFLSLFSDRSYDYFRRNNISYGDIGTAIIVQRMVQAEVSGIMYTYDPITNNSEHVSIEAVFGLGDVLAEGSVNPDIYTVSKSSLEITEKKIVPQEWMKVRKMGDQESLEHLQKITISKMWQYSQKLDDSLVRELAALADRIEQATGTPQVIEWAMERGSLYVLQAKSMELDAAMAGPKIHEADKKITTLTDIDKFSELADTTQITTSHEAPESAEKPAIVLPQETLLFSGTPSSSGVAYGEVLLITSAEALTEEQITLLKDTTSKKHIIVTDEFTAALEPLFYMAGGVVSNFGGANSDVGLITREAKIPAVVGTRIATSYLQSGSLIKIDGSSGAVYRVDFLPEIPEETIADDRVVHKKKKLKKKKVVEPQATVTETAVTEKPLEVQPILTSRTIKHHAPFKVFLTANNVSGATYLPSKHASIPHDASFIMAPITDASVNERVFVKNIKKTTTASLYLALSDAPSIDALLAAKRTLAAHGIRRSKRVPYLVDVSTMFGLLNCRTLIELGVDGVLFNLPKLAAAYRPGSTEFDAELLRLVADSLVGVKKQKLTFVGLALPKEYFTIPFRKELRALLQHGVTALVFVEPIPHAMESDIQKMEEEVMGVQLG